MKPTTYLHVALLLAALVTCNTAFPATTGELLQQGLYAEEVEGNIDAAIKAYGQVIQNSSAPANHVAQALYRQGMCYMKLKDETSARAALERLVSQYANQTDIVGKAIPILDDLTDFDPASLMPAGTLVYVEFGSPGRQVETILGMLKGTPFENPLAAVAGQQGNNNGQKSPGDIVGALLNPSMMAEFKKIRSSAVGITGISQNQPQMISVLYPGKSDALRGLILAGLGMAGKPGEAIEGMQTVNLPEDMAVAYDERVVIMARPASQLEWSVKKYKGKANEPTLASSNASFAKLNKTQRQQNVMTLWAKVDATYAHALKLFPEGQVPPQLLAANAMIDFNHIDDLIVTESVETNGFGSRIEFHFKDGHHCLAYDLIRTPNISKAALEAAPAEAVAVASFSMNQATTSQAEAVRSQVQNVTGLDIGRELFSNIEQVTLFAMPADKNSTNAFLPGRFGLAITSRKPDQTRQVLDTLLGATGATPSGQNDRFKVSKAGQPDLYCHVVQVNGITLLSLDRSIVDASVASIKNHKSICASGPLNKAVNNLAPSASKLLLVNAGGAIRLFGPMMKPAGMSDEDTKELSANLEQLARAADETVLQLHTDERLNALTMNSAIMNLPPLYQAIGPATQISRIIEKGRAEAIAKNLRREKPAIVMPASKAPAIDGQEDEAWKTVSRNKLENVVWSFGSGEKASAPSSPDDLSADFRAMWDENYLYLLVDVTDDNLIADTVPDQTVTVPTGSQVIPWWYDDSIEVYIDADNAKSDQYGKSDAQIRFNWSTTKPGMRSYNQNVETQLQGVEFATVPTDKGYRTEIKLPWAAFGVKPNAGATIGLDVHVNDDDNGGERDKKITWHDTQDNCWQTPRAFGNAALAGLIGWWKFDETQGTSAADSSGGNHNGTLVGNAKWASGKSGGAIDLDGAGSFVRIADKAAFDISGEVTIACWVNFRSAPADWAGIVTKGDSAWRLSTFEQQRLFHFGVNNFAGGGDNVSVNAQTSVNAGEWHHVAGTFDGSVLNLYVDGKLETTKPWAGGLGRNDFEVLIGENAETTNRCFNGLLDDVRIYNYALPEAGVKSLAAGE